MTSKPQVHSQFTVSSGCLCYGHLHNMWHGKSMPIQPFPSVLERETGGTVLSQLVHFNIAAQNGTWLAYQLMDNRTNEVAAWFVCHSHVNPETEIDKILRVSGAPYEDGSGSRFLDESTVAEGVLPINRYDWGYYDYRCRENVADTEVEANESEDTYVYGEHVGLVDYGHAEEYIEEWKGVRAHKRANQIHGLWMTIESEYMFGRFGFNDDRTAARSFLWFAIDTRFTQTTFAGMERTLRVEALEESGEEKFQRQLREGCKLDGLDELHEQIKLFDMVHRIPPEAECLGPYAANEHILHAADVDALRLALQLPDGVGHPEFPEPLKDANVALLNNVLMSYLEKVMVPASSAQATTSSIAASLFPDYETLQSIDGQMHAAMTRPSSRSIEGHDGVAVGERIQRFFALRCGDGNLARDDEFIAGLVAVVAYLVSELLELANNYRRDCMVSSTGPLHLRLAVKNDDDLLDMFRFSKMYWYGDGTEPDAGEGTIGEGM
ncbi:hypothetical protein MHUMG1_06037 [Metarhizium humberi]|uniref:Histone-fold protein n=1 Tax=Metarhizium humberi TaxID=2596975 RepID=A0A9P8S616_9HYPO|nr:hypothetical protein MHUMG1_06037 [Metarhizium humberi]